MILTALFNNPTAYQLVEKPTIEVEHLFSCLMDHPDHSDSIYYQNIRCQLATHKIHFKQSPYHALDILSH